MLDAPKRRLEVTRRCLEDDLGIYGATHWRDHLADVPVLRAFGRRDQVPEGPEPIEQVLRVLPRAPVFSLHSGDDRAGTWYDQDEDIVWLVGVGHAHDYDHLERLARRGQLLPTEADYEALDADVPDRFSLERMGREARKLREEARARPGVVVQGELASIVNVRVCFENGDPSSLTVAVSQRLTAGAGRVPATWMYIVAQAFFPGSGYPDDYHPFAEEIDQTYVRSDELALYNFINETV